MNSRKKGMTLVDKTEKLQDGFYLRNLASNYDRSHEFLIR